MFVFRQVACQTEMEALYRLRYDIYCTERGFLPLDAYTEPRESDEYDPYSIHLIAVEPQTDTLLGSMRLIRANPYGFPCEQQFQLKEHTTPTPARTLEISRLVIAPIAKDYWKYVCIGLVKEYLRYAMQTHIEYSFAILEKPMIHQLQRLGLPLELLGDGHWYSGGVTYPCWIPTASYVQAILMAPRGTWYYDYMRVLTDELAALHALNSRAARFMHHMQ